jgi:alpha-N-acetylglucosaminidase
MRGADQDAVWVMQGWLFTNDAGFWKEKQLDAYLGGVPKDRIVILDLFSEVMPVWNRRDLERPTPIETRPWIWNMLHSFGGNSGMYGRMQAIARDPVRAYAQSSGMIGIGITTEGIEQNPVVYELMAEMRWHELEVDIEVWIRDWADRRMGPSSHYRHRCALNLEHET